ncbi:MAG: mRNA surveillance protein pelota [Methanolinea sp.]|nr:mRNA surveillance protein pelota [Methanolinea sp.]
MKAEMSGLKNSTGEIRLFPENADDLWHLSHLVGPGDLVFATTFRTVDAPSDKIRPEKMEKRPVRLGIRVERVELHEYANRLRVSGTIEHGTDMGAHHTLNVEPGYEISVVKPWRTHELERIERAVKASVHGLVHVLAIEEGEATLFRMRQSGPEEVTTLVVGSGKGSDASSRPAFFEKIAEELSSLPGPLVIAGPGFVKDDLMQFLASRSPGLAERAIVVETRRTGAGAVQEVIGLGVLDRVAEDVQLGREVRAVEELVRRIAMDLPVAYGQGEVEKAIDYGAAEEVLVCDSLLRVDGVVRILDRAEHQKARVIVLSEYFEPGKQLLALGGIAALLRFRVR